MLKTELSARPRAAGGRPVLPVALSLGGIALVDLLAAWPEAPVEACVTVGSQAPLLYTFDAIPSMPYDEADPPHLPVPWLNIYDSRDFLSFLAEPLFRRSDGLASVVDLRVHSGKDFPKSHSAYWELAPVWDAIATAFTWKRIEPLTVREARRLGFEAREAPQPEGSEAREGLNRGRRTVPPGGRGPSAMEAGRCCEQDGEDRTKGQDRVHEDPRTRRTLDLQGPPPVRQPGYLREARGFASPPRDGFAIFGRSAPPGTTLTDGNRLRPRTRIAREA